MQTKAWQSLIAVIVALGIPVAGVAKWHHLAAGHPIAALVLATVWLVMFATAVSVRKALAGPAQRRLEQAGNAADLAAGWWLSGYGRRYRRWVLDSRRYIDVKDLATGGDHTPELDDVYIDVALVGRAPHQVPTNPVGDIPEDATGRHSVSEFLDHAEPVVLAILGPPGCGKSTLLAHIARRTAQAGRRQRGRIPVLLTLREQAAMITADSQPTLPDVARAALSSMPDKEPSGWWDQQFKRGRCVIMFDGLDEVPRDEDRRVVAKWVEQQINYYPGNDFVVTSRPHGFPGLVIAQANILAVRPFTFGQVSLFLNRWYLTTERHATGATTDAQLRSVRILARRSANRLIALLRANPTLYALTINPLFLTMIAMVHRYRGALPGSRADLYREICQVMLSRRTQAKDLPEFLPGPAKLKLLTTLAYQMMVDHVSELPAERALEILVPLMRRLPLEATGQAFLDDASHNGLLVEPTPGRYAFAHLTFQEYLAAQHANDLHSHSRTLTDAVDDQWWRESILFYTAIADADKIVRACLDKGTIRTLALAFDCAESCSELAPDLRQRLDEARDRAFTEDCDPRYRQLVAAVLAVRLSHQVTVTTAGNRICKRPVPADLYWLFIRDTHAIEPDDSCEPDPENPAIGMWSTEATAFVRWLNDLTSGASQTVFRLPGPDELELEQVVDELAKCLPARVTGLWSRRTETESAQLWIREGHGHPHNIAADAILQAVVVDAKDTAILALILAISALDTAFTVFQLLLVAYALKNTDDADDAILRLLSVSRARARDITRNLTRELDYGRDLTGALELAHTLDRALISALDGTRDRELTGALYRARELTSALAHAFDLDLDGNLDLALDCALTRDRGLSFDPDLIRALASDHALTRGLTRGLTRALDGALAVNGDRFARLGIQLLDMPNVPLAWVIEGPLGDASQEVDPVDRSPSPPTWTFANRLAQIAGISGKSTITATFGESLTESLHRIDHAAPPHDQADGTSSLGDLASRLADSAAQVLASHHQLTDTHAAAIRVLALALTASFSEQNGDLAYLLQTLAATVTLLQKRANGTAPIGEAMVLALA